MAPPEIRYRRKAKRRIKTALKDGQWHGSRELWERTSVRALLRWNILREWEAEGRVEARWDTRYDPWERQWRWLDIRPERPHRGGPRRGGAIRGGAPHAPALLREKIAALRADHDMRKRVNETLRAVGRCVTDRQLIREVCDLTGWPPAVVAQVIKLDAAGRRRGFTSRDLARGVRAIRRLEARLADIETR